MKIYVLFGQQKEDYPGQYAPEALEVMDEYAWEDNSTWLLEKLSEYEKDRRFEALKIIEVDVGSQETIRELLIGLPSLRGKVLTQPGE